MSSALAGRVYTTSITWEALISYNNVSLKALLFFQIFLLLLLKDVINVDILQEMIVLKTNS